MGDVRKFKIVIPKTTIFYEVDMDTFRETAEMDREPADETFLEYKLRDDIDAAFEFGRFGDDYWGLFYVEGNEYWIDGKVTVEEVTDDAEVRRVQETV